jgi:DNA-binding FadR family transcriptional regulator
VSDTSDGLKLGERVARQTHAWIMAENLVAGHRLGTEEDLARRHGVSRWIAREAIAIMEMDGWIESRRGGAGGLYVSAPADDLRIAVLRHFLVLSGATPAQLAEVRRVVEGQMLARVMRHLTTDDARMLRQFKERPAGPAPHFNTAAILRTLLRISGQPGLTLFALALLQANTDRAIWNGTPPAVIQRLSEEVLALRLEQVEALIGEDEASALALDKTIAEMSAEAHSRYADPPQDIETAIDRCTMFLEVHDVKERTKTAKKPEAVARLLAQQIISGGLKPGDSLGAEDELLSLLRVGRSVLREAKRLLERYGIVKVLRGHHGGVLVARADPLPIIRATSLHLSPSYAASPGSFHRIAAQLLLIAAETVTGRARTDSLVSEELGRFRRRTEEFDQLEVREQALDFFELLARASGNPVLDCVMRSISFQIGFSELPVSPDIIEARRLLRRELADAIDHGDAALARRAASNLWRTGAVLLPTARQPAEILTLAEAGDM